MNTTIGGDVARYAGAVRAAFADLDAPTPEMLLEDLEDQMQEVATEAGGPLEERLGAPETYAAELRGYLPVQAASMVVSTLSSGQGLSFPFPQFFGSRVLGLLAVVAAPERRPGPTPEFRPPPGELRPPPVPEDPSG